MLRSNIQLVECVKKIEVDREATVQAHACRSNDAGAQHITVAASAEITGCACEADGTTTVIFSLSYLCLKIWKFYLQPPQLCRGFFI